MKKRFYNLEVKTGARAARFVVDLKKDRPEPEAAPVKMNQLEKLVEADYGKIFKAGKVKIKAATIKSVNNALKIFRFAQDDKKAVVRDVRLIERLAFAQLGKLLFGLFYKICYAIGWAVIFTFRLVYFAGRALFGPFKKLFIILFFKFIRFFKDLPAGYQTARAAVRGLRDDNKTAYLKPVLIFAGALLVIILPVKAFSYYKSLDIIKGKVLGASESALNDFFSAGKAAADLDFAQADANFTLAGNGFLKARQELREINDLIFVLAALAPDENTRLAASAPHILKAGELSSRTGRKLSLVMESIFKPEPGNAGNILINLSKYGRDAAQDLDALNAELNQINSANLPPDYRENFDLLKNKTAQLSAGFNQFISLIGGLRSFLGESMDKRYLLVFQNNAELRGSGGFIGSYAVIDFSQGGIKNLETPGGGSYDTEAGLLKKIKSPEPLSLVRPDWHFWDANWWPDWPKSARKLAWFYENSGGSTVDGVLAFTPTVVERLLKIIGPIDMSGKYGLIFDADNFWLETQKLAEQKPDITNQPKKIIGDLMNKIIEELPKRINKDNLASLFEMADRSLADKNILFYFSDPALEAKTEDFGWDGKIKNTDGDYLNVINTNIAGGKSDRAISQEIIHRAQILPDGAIIVDLTVKRVHHGARGEPFSGVRNVNWMRIYVPLGSVLLEAEGFRPPDKIFFKQTEKGWLDDADVYASEGRASVHEPSSTKIYSEFNKTVFANWSQLDPGESDEIRLKYRLPFKLSDKKSAEKFFNRLIAGADSLMSAGQKNFYSYSLLIQKQPGMNSSTIASELKLSDNFKEIWSHKLPDYQVLDTDKMTAVLFEKM